MTNKLSVEKSTYMRC